MLKVKKNYLMTKWRKKIQNLIKSYAKTALRTIAFTYKDLKEQEGGPLHEELFKG
jgi:magnesium-transporting ATPase (P-type)